jgi:hypothetical protein
MRLPSAVADNVRDLGDVIWRTRDDGGERRGGYWLLWNSQSRRGHQQAAESAGIAFDGSAASSGAACTVDAMGIATMIRTAKRFCGDRSVLPCLPGERLGQTTRRRSDALSRRSDRYLRSDLMMSAGMSSRRRRKQRLETSKHDKRR